MTDTTASLEVRDLTVRFGGIVALDSVSLEVRPNEVMGVIGPNGAGKTTLFNAICGFVRPAGGELRYRGRHLHRERPHHLLELGIARTLQGLGLWPGLTVLENVMVGAGRQGRAGFGRAVLGLPRADIDEDRLRGDALGLLREMGVERFAGQHPQELPFGAQKWVMLARALISRPSLLLLDEPASGLTAGEMSELGDLIKGWKGSMAIALVEHRLDLVMSACDRVTVLDFGRVIAAGSPAQVRDDPAVADAYLGEELGSDVA